MQKINLSPTASGLYIWQKTEEKEGYKKRERVIGEGCNKGKRRRGR
jgi:hypothetical protein